MPDRHVRHELTTVRRPRLRYWNLNNGWNWNWFLFVYFGVQECSHHINHSCLCNTNFHETKKLFSRALVTLLSTYTEGEIKVCTGLREISSCSCLTVLPGPAWVLLSKTCKPLLAPLYLVEDYSDALCRSCR